MSGAQLRETYTACVDVLLRAAERRSTVADTITLRMRSEVPTAHDQAWSDLEMALEAEDAARAALRELLDGRRA